MALSRPRLRVRFLRGVGLTLLGCLATSSFADDAPWKSAIVPTNGGAGDWIAEKCEIAVEGDVLRFVSGEGWVRYPYPLADFVFRGEYRPLKEAAWDSGIYFRSPLPPAGKNWPDRRQINLKQGEEGVLLGPRKATDQSVIKEDEWRAFELVVAGDKASYSMNGKLVWETDGVTDPVGWLALQCEVPQGGAYEFRKLEVIETGMRDLLTDGLGEWTAIENEPLDCWKVDGGSLSCLPQKGPSLRTKEALGDFTVRLGYRLAEGGNSGVYLRTPESGSHHGEGAGIEVQLLDDGAKRYAELQPYQYTGSLYGIVPAKRGGAHGPGEWNSMQITCVGPTYQVILNGQTIVQATADDVPELAKRAVAGHLGLQHHGGGVDYRDVRVGPPAWAP